MKHFLLFGLIWGICLSAIHAQSESRALVQSYVDSMQSLLEAGQYAQIVTYGESAIQSAKEKLGEEDTLVASLYSRIAYPLLIQNQIARALSYLQQSKDLWTQASGPLHVEVGRNAHTMAKAYYLLAEFDDAINNCQEAIDIFEQTLGSDHLEIAGPYNTMGGVYINLRDHDKTLKYFLASLEIRKKHLGDNHAQVGMSYNNIGAVYKEKDDWERAKHYIELGLDIKLQTLGENHLSLSRSYRSLADVLREQGDWELATTYQKKSLALTTKILGNNHPDVSSDLYELGILADLMRKKELALDYSKEVLRIRQVSMPFYHLDMAGAYLFMGRMHVKLKQYDEAFDAYQKASSIYLKVSGAKSPSIAIVYARMGEYFHLKGELEQALDYHQKELDIHESVYGSSHSVTSQSYNNVANALSSIGQQDEALALFKQSLDIELRVFGDNHPNIARKYGWMALAYSRDKDYSRARVYAQKAFTCLTHFRRTHHSKENKEVLLAKNYYLFENAIQYVLDGHQHDPASFDLHETFLHSEQVKSALLLEALQTTKAVSFAGIPDSLIQQEYDLSVEIAYYDKLRFEEEEKGGSRNDSILSLYLDKLFVVKEQHSELLSLFEQSYPDYYRLKYDPSVNTVGSIQHKLAENEALIEYFIGAKQNYVFLVLKDSFIVHTLSKEFPLNQHVEHMRKGMFQYHLSSSIQASDYAAYNDTFTLASSALYQYLIAPIQKILPERLIIIPSGVLGYVPFEALLIERPGQAQLFKSHTYLLRKHQISYCYSATLLEEMQSHSTPRFSDRLLAIAPSFDLEKDTYASMSEQRAGLGPLLYNIPEVNGIQELLGGTVISGKAATKDQFIDQCSRAQILHLATHGKANDAAGEYSYLAFAESSDSLIDQKLYARELYTLHIPADLVVLSACETGIGELQFGEGIVSLARGFSYAGAKSILTSLWRVSDASTAELMQSFYAHLRQGMPKDAALRQAKLEFLEKHPHDEAHPYFWAGFVPIGDMAPIELQRNYWPLLIGVLFLLVIGLGFWRLKGNKAKAS